MSKRKAQDGTLPKKADPVDDSGSDDVTPRARCDPATQRVPAAPCPRIRQPVIPTPRAAGPGFARTSWPFDIDNQLFDISALADLILSQPLLGSTVKCDGNESDPYAFLTVLNLHQHREHAAIQQLSAFLQRRARGSDSPLSQLPALLDPASPAQVGLILQERFINIPHQVVPPMYTMLEEEMAWAIDAQEPYQFTHYLLISKTYMEVDSMLDTEDDRPGKRLKQPSAGGKAPQTFYFHPEDEVWQKHAMGFRDFDYETKADEGAADAKRAFQEAGVRPQGHLILMDKAGFEKGVKDVVEFLGGA
nr:protein bcp1 [Quercus suber]